MRIIQKVWIINKEISRWNKDEEEEESTKKND